MTIPVTEIPNGAGASTLKSESKQAVALTTKTVSHIEAYPLVSDTLKFVLEFQFVVLITKYLSAAISRAIELISLVPGLVPIINFIDRSVDSVLSALDSRFPKLAKISFADILAFFDYAFKRAVDFVKAYTGAIYGRTKPYVDPAAKKVNDLYEYALNETIPSKSGEPEAPKDTPDELGRSYILAKETYHRVEPYARQVREIPSHVSSVYQDEKSKASSTQEAITKATARVSKEAYETIQPGIQKLVSVIRPEADGKSAVPDSTNVDGDVSAEATGAEI